MSASIVQLPPHNSPSPLREGIRAARNAPCIRFELSAAAPMVARKNRDHQDPILVDGLPNPQERSGIAGAGHSEEDTCGNPPGNSITVWLTGSGL